MNELLEYSFEHEGLGEAARDCLTRIGKSSSSGGSNSVNVQNAGSSISVFCKTVRSDFCARTLQVETNR